MDFKTFFTEADKHDKDVKATMNKLPKAYAKLARPYRFIFQNGNTLSGDGGHVGFIDEEKKTITIAAPWNYGREYAVLHEVGHIVWKYVAKDNHRKEWTKIVEATKDPRQHQGMEELFCMAFANCYAKNKIVIHSHPTWDKFIKRLAK